MPVERAPPQQAARAVARPAAAAAAAAGRGASVKAKPAEASRPAAGGEDEELRKFQEEMARIEAEEAAAAGAAAGDERPATPECALLYACAPPLFHSAVLRTIGGFCLHVLLTAEARSLHETCSLGKCSAQRRLCCALHLRVR